MSPEWWALAGGHSNGRTGGTYAGHVCRPCVWTAGHPVAPWTALRDGAEEAARHLPEDGCMAGTWRSQDLKVERYDVHQWSPYDMQ